MNKRIHLPRSFFSTGLFLYLIPLIFLLERYYQMQGAITPIELFYCLCLSWLGSWLFAIGFWRIFRNDQKAHIMTALLVFINCYFGIAKEQMEDITSMPFISSYSFLFTITFLFLAGVFYLLYRAPSLPLKMGKWLTIILLSISGIFIAKLSLPLLSEQKKSDELISHAHSFKTFPVSQRPDIYIIVADGYAGRSELRGKMDFNNDPFYDSLRRRGFWVADSSRSNYRFTPLSIASTFSMNYSTTKKIDPGEIIKAKQIISHNTFFEQMKRNGYDFKNYSIFDDPIHKNPETIDAFEYNGFQLLYYGTLLQHISMLIDAYIYKKADILEIDYSTAKKIRKSNEYVISMLIKESNSVGSKPKLIYSHLLAPHFPYLSDSCGNLFSENISRSISRFSTDHYIQYLKGWNRIFLRTIDSIQQNTRNKAAILFFSDHGFRQFEKPQYYENYYSNLLTAYLPYQHYEHFYEGMSNVNYIRAFLNQQFSQNLPLLKDSMVLFPINRVRLKKD